MAFVLMTFVLSCMFCGQSCHLVTCEVYIYSHFLATLCCVSWLPSVFSVWHCRMALSVAWFMDAVLRHCLVSCGFKVVQCMHGAVE